MTDEQTHIPTVEMGGVSPADIDSLGESVLGRALRWLEAGGSDGGSGSSTPIAAFQDSF
jgi:hypothetical protein